MQWFKEKENRLALFLTFLLLVMHLIIINRPGEMVFDETHYVNEANSIIAGEGLLHPEHPSLGKLFIALGILLFGNKAFGWRIFSVLFGVTSILLFYLICQKLTTKRWVPILATFIFAFENLNFVQASVAMLDVFSVTFMLASFLLFLKGKYLPAGVAVALSALAKLPGAFAAGTILLYWLFTKRKPILNGLRFLISAPLAFLALMPLVDYLATGHFLYPWERIWYMLTTHASLTFATTTHGGASRPWDWIIFPKVVAYWWNPLYLGVISWTLWALIVPAVGFMIYEIKKRDEFNFCLFSLFWFLSTYLVWIPIELVTNRIMFVFYFYPTIGAICLAVGLGLQELLAISAKTNKKLRWSIRILASIWLIAHVVILLLITPLCSSIIVTRFTG